MKTLKLSLFAGVWGSALAAANPRDVFPTFSVGVDAAYYTHKSKLVESNDTGLAYNAKVHAFAGGDKTLGVGVRYRLSNSTFELNTSSISSTQIDTVMSYRLSYFYIGATYGSVELEVSQDGSKTLDGVSSTYGGNFGFVYPWFRQTSLYADIIAFMGYKAKEASNLTLTYGLCYEADFGVNFDLYKRSVDLISGFCYSTRTITTDSGSKAESVTAPYLGIRLENDF